MKNTLKCVKNEQGSAIVLVIIAIMVIMVLGLTSLIVSTNNVKMAGKFRSSNKEYYELENTAEKVLKEIDIKLKKAEELSLEYMKVEQYSRSVSDRENPYVYQGDIYKEENQEFFFKRWNDKVYTPSLVDIVDLKNKAKKIVDPAKYNEKMEDFFNEAFSRVYYNIAAKELTEIDKYIQYNCHDIIKQGIKLNSCLDINSARNFKNIDENSIWEVYEPEYDDIKVKINVTDKKGRKLNVQVNVVPPTYEAVEKRTFSVIKQNEVYGEAINTYGTVDLSRSMNNPQISNLPKNKLLEAIDKTALTVDSKKTGKDKFGIIFLNKSDGNQYTIDKDENGIIYSEGDLTINGNGTFKGAIIVEGNVTVEGDVKIIHDKDTIVNLLKSDKRVRNFFKPGANGIQLVQCDDNDLNVRARKPVIKDRYKIAEWKEE